MDVSFHCPKCDLHISSDAEAVGEEINCPQCEHTFRIPPGRPARDPVPVLVKKTTSITAIALPADTFTQTGPAPLPSGPAPKPDAKPAATGPEHKPLVVPHRHGPQESLVKKASSEEDKAEAPKIRVRCIKRGSCVEVGHDRFDEVVTDFLNKVGKENIIHMSAISYGAMDSTGHMLPDYGIMIIYHG
ncbi:MAG: hypothetical protein WCS99_17955 [Limisphaerales bacterium]